MGFRPFDVNIPHIMYAVLGGFIVLFGMFSLLIREKLYFGEAPLAFVFGIVIGPYGANIVNPRSWGGGTDEIVNQITLEVTRVILAIGVFAIGVELPKAYMAKHWRSLLFLLFPVMTFGWLVSAGLIFALIPGLNFLSSLAVAACLTPTDPILAAAVVGGKYADKHVPAHLRHLLAAESGCNDGAAFPFLYLALYLITDVSDEHAIQDWFLITWLYEVVFGIFFGSVIGFAFRHLMKFCERKDLIDRQSYVAQYLSLAMFTIGVTTMLGSDDLLAAFACGTAFAWDGFFNKQTEQSVFSSVIDLLFNIAAFIFIGAWMPFNLFDDVDLTLSVWRLLVIAILILLLRRLPIILALYRWIPDIKTFREAVFSGHFGPIGVGAVFISTLASEMLQHPEHPPANQQQMVAATIQPIVAFMVLCSIAVHGLSIPFFTFGRAVHSVSRTWSRHPSIEPEWATHTRRVTRPEEIVINRDSAMERGEASEKKVMVDVEELRELRDLRDQKEKDMLQTDAPPFGVTDEKQNVDGEEPAAGDETAKREARPDSPPDGDDLQTEWREGHDVIRETRAGPGEEVEVEVLRHAIPPDDLRLLRESRLSPERLEREAKRIGERVGERLRHWHAMSRSERMVFDKKGEEASDEGAAETAVDAAAATIAGPSAKGRSKEKRPATASDDDEPDPTGASSAKTRSRVSSRHASDVEDDDAGWTSDRSERSQELSVTGGESERHRSRSPRQRVAFRTVAPHHSKRRTSIRRGILSGGRASRPVSSEGPSSSVASSGAEDEDGAEQARGRTSTASRSAPASLSMRHRTAFRRVDSLIGEISRASSPARSILSNRYSTADDSNGNNGNGGGSGSGSQAGRGGVSEDKDSPTSPMRVVFDLPRDSPK